MFHSLVHSCSRCNDCDVHKKALRLASVIHWQESCDGFIFSKCLSVYFTLSNTRGRHTSSLRYNDKKNNNNSLTRHTKHSWHNNSVVLIYTNVASNCYR